MGMNKYDLPDAWHKRRTMMVFEDFRQYTTANEWTSVLGGAASAVVGDGVGGILTLSTIDSTNNLLAGIKHTNSLFKFVNNEPIELECFLQYTEANVNAANVAFGIMSAVSSTALQDDGAGPKASFSGAIIYKVDGGTQWKTASSVGTTNNISQSDTTAGGASYSRLGIRIEPVSSTIAEVTYFVDGVQLKTSGGRPGTSLIKDQLTYTGTLNMQLFACIKSGTTTPEILNVDWIGGVQLRALLT